MGKDFFGRTYIVVIYLCCVVDFPAITICNLNPIRLSAFTPSDLYNAGKMYDVIDDNMALKEDLFSDDNPQVTIHWSLIHWNKTKFDDFKWNWLTS